MWGSIAASAVVIGAVAGVIRDWNDRRLGLVLGFGAGALLAGISFELAEKGFRVAGAIPVAVGLGLGAIVFYSADRVIKRLTRGAQAIGLALALGALLDGIPEQAVLGLGMNGGERVSLALLVAIFVSNLPEAIGSASEMRRAGDSRKVILAGWLAVAVLSAAATVLGYLLHRVSSPNTLAGIDGFAAGALLVMLVVSMIPDAREKADDLAGLAAVLGFAVAAGLSLGS